MPSTPEIPPFPRPIRQLMRPLGISSSGMSTQQGFIEVIARNMANSETTRTPEGGPYRRQVVSVSTDPATGETGPRVSVDTRPGRQVYDPGHPDANADGIVEYPNVDVTQEMVDLMLARRVFEANASVFQAAKAMLRRALDI